MTKIGRNSLCPCGSGKKYKKCCINKKDNSILSELPLSLQQTNENLTFKQYVSNNNSIELLKIFSLLQLIPRNQSKEFRLEDIQMTICRNLNSNQSAINYKELKYLIHKEYRFSHREDPCEASFTENIMFFNGNNIVFPGMTNNSTVLNQNLLHAILFNDNNVSKKTKNKVKEGAFFILHVFNEIANTLNYSRNIFEDKDWKGEIFFPKSVFLKENSSHFEFSKEKITSIYELLKIKSDIITEFVSSFDEIKKSTLNGNTLVSKPFIEYNNNYYLVMPSCQMISLNRFIMRIVKDNNEVDELSDSYERVVKNEMYKYLSSLWRRVDVTTQLLDEESIWQFDTNKYAYVCLLNFEAKDYEERANHIINSIKIEYGKDDIEFLALHVTVPKSTEMGSLKFGKIYGAKYQLALSYFNIERLITNWSLDKLSIWKYLKAQERAENKGVIVHPAFTILTYFKWYKTNFESFFPIDDKYPNLIYFDFSFQGEVVIEANKKNDRHFILHYNENVLSYLPVIKTETYAPIYTSEEIFNGFLRICIEKYICPIWISLENPNDIYGKKFIDAILFWLNEFHETLNPLITSLESLPIEIVLEFEESFEEISIEKIESNELNKIVIKYRIDPYTRTIFMKVPIGIFNALNRSDNHGERILMSCVIKGFSNLLQIANYNEITEETIEYILDKHMPLNSAKMILTMTTNNIQTEKRYIPKVRFLQDADTAIVLEDNVKWLNWKETIPDKISDSQEKIKLCFDLINSLINQLRNRLQEYNSQTLLEFLMLKHEALIHEGASWSMQIPTRLACFSKHLNVVEEYSEYEGKRIKTSLAMRNLIEFVVAEPYYGDKKENDDDIDFLLAIMYEIINYGTIKDSIKFNIDNPEIGLLPSGRIGIDHDFYNKILKNYRNDTTNDEIVEYKESFGRKFRNTKESTSNTSPLKKNKSDYNDKVDSAFQKDWGISLLEIDSILFFLSEYCLKIKKSNVSCSENDFKLLLKEELNLKDRKIESFIQQMVLETRGKIDKPKNSKDYPEIFPWRYNRKFSYVRRPVLKLKNHDNSYTFFWSMRHLDMATKNLQAIFYNGVMKVDPVYKNINRLLAEQNNIKGKNFRTKVYNWLINNSSLEVVPYEVTIKEKGVFKAEKNYGDIDILAFDHNKKTIYSLECKNTKQAKIMYDFSNNIRNYIEKQLPKHLNREKWLKNNAEQIKNTFNLESNSYIVKSIVISSYQVPVKYIHNTSIPLYSFNEIKTKNIFE